MARNLAETFQALYDSEIHVTITWTWDAGERWCLGNCCETALPEIGDLPERMAAISSIGVLRSRQGPAGELIYFRRPSGRVTMLPSLFTTWRR